MSRHRELDTIYVDIETGRAYYKYGVDKYLSVTCARRATIDETEICQMSRPDDIVKYRRVIDD